MKVINSLMLIIFSILFNNSIFHRLINMYIYVQHGLKLLKFKEKVTVIKMYTQKFYK